MFIKLSMPESARMYKGKNKVAYRQSLLQKIRFTSKSSINIHKEQTSPYFAHTKTGYLLKKLSVSNILLSYRYNSNLNYPRSFYDKVLNLQYETTDEL